MVLRLDPRIPLVWRDPFSLQFGVEPARIVLREVSGAEERMIAALSIGVSEAGLGFVAQAAGASAGDASRLLDRLRPLLVPVAEAGSRRTVVVVGRGPTRDQIAAALTDSGVVVTDEREADCDLAVAVGHFVFDPELYGFWLRRDIPHLPVLFGDGVATVGPLVEPGSGPCLYCVEFYRRDTDARWSTLASQLWGRRSAAETPLASREVAALASRLVLSRLLLGRLRPAQPGRGAGRPSTATSFRLDVEDGSIVRREWLPHPDCGCQGSAPLSAVRRGNGSAGAGSSDSVPPQPRTGEAVGEPA